MNTAFANKINPWTQQKMTKTNKPYRAPQITDVSELSICNDPPPVARTHPEGKYSALFAKLPAGKRLKCPTGKAGPIGQQLRKWMQKNGVPGSVKSTEKYGDGAGGVWLMAPVEAAKPVRRVA